MLPYGILLLVKKNPSQVGYGLLQHFQTSDDRKGYELAQQAAFDWNHCVDMDWKFRIVTPQQRPTYGPSEPFYDDDWVDPTKQQRTP